MVFVLAVLGCAVLPRMPPACFSVKSPGKLAPFGPRRHPAPVENGTEQGIGPLSLGSCAAGALLGVPLSWGIWQIFRTMIVDTEEVSAF